MTQSSKITIHMAASLDGFIAKKDGSVSWLDTNDSYENGVQLSPEAITSFLGEIDCYVMGSHTYELALQLGWPYGDKPAIVLTSRRLTSDKKSVEFQSGDLPQVVNQHLTPKYKNIWMVGGAQLTKDFLRNDLADEIVVSILPIIIGDGILFFDYVGCELPLHLKDARAYKNGIVELSYEIKKEIG